MAWLGTEALPEESMPLWWALYVQLEDMHEICAYAEGGVLQCWP
jgi:hypothetical protein